ncbi:MAG: hypothetical protein IPQ05_09630 [Leptospiraceae bacterium]|nr:hypothetical protein [Leptospiraceae bacterium]MBL0264119.1 hypothetical protein [Leptospiraceae bacterium]
MATEQIKNPVLISLLKDNREKLNSLFSFYKFSFPVIEKEVIFFYIGFVIEPVFEKNQSRGKEELSLLLLTLYEKILELVGKNYLGNSGRYPFFENKFIQCIESSNDRLFENPEVYISSIANAIFNIGNFDLKILEIWLAKFQKLIIKAKNNKELFQAGIVAAWVSGMAQYRETSLEIMKTLDMELLQIILDNSNIKNLNRERFIERLSGDPWLSPENAMKENSPPKKILIRRISGFTGFGGHFNKPPEIEYLNGNFVVSDSLNSYVIYADIFGSYLQKISDDMYLSLTSSQGISETTNFKITKTGNIQNGKEAINYSPLVNYSSIASNEFTCCASSPYSHCIFVLGLG